MTMMALRLARSGAIVTRSSSRAVKRIPWLHVRFYAFKTQKHSRTQKPLLDGNTSESTISNRNPTVLPTPEITQDDWEKIYITGTGTPSVGLAVDFRMRDIPVSVTLLTPKIRRVTDFHSLNKTLVSPQIPFDIVFTRK